MALKFRIIYSDNELLAVIEFIFRSTRHVHTAAISKRICSDHQFSIFDKQNNLTSKKTKKKNKVFYTLNEAAQKRNSI
jgi:hypothetical protein